MIFHPERSFFLNPEAQRGVSIAAIHSRYPARTNNSVNQQVVVLEQTVIALGYRSLRFAKSWNIQYNRLRHDNHKTCKPADLARYHPVECVFDSSAASAVAAEHAAQISQLSKRNAGHSEARHCHV